MGLRCAAWVLVTSLLFCASAAAEPGSSQEAGWLVEFHFTPAERASFALWIEKADGTFLRTVRLTEAVALRGIGNRPGALQLNSGFRWPYGRREGVLPVWAHRRAGAPGAEKFPRIIFQDRISEGYASQTSADESKDDYFCLSFDKKRSKRDALDAVSCASVFNSDKGRYMTKEDVRNGYAEPWETKDGTGRMRELSLKSFYPPRRDVTRCGATQSENCHDHPDVAEFASDAREVMPTIDAATMATPAGNEPQTIRFMVPGDWEEGRYVAFLEINTEGDYNDHYNPDIYPTPDVPENKWDHWAKTFGYPYRSQPSVVYRIPFELTPEGATYDNIELAGHGAVQGRDGEIHPPDMTLTDDPMGHPGSGADRLRATSEGSRLRARVIATNVCDQPDPPASCGRECGPSMPCDDGFLCSSNGTCVGRCDTSMQPGPVGELTVEPHPDKKKSHQFAHLQFTAPPRKRPIAEYRVRYSADGPIDDPESFERAREAKRASVQGERLTLPTDAKAGERVESDFGVLVPQTRYHVAVRAVDVCGQAGPLSTAEVTTTKIHFTQVSPTPCFVATAAYGTPMARDIFALRRFRDRYLKTHAPGRFLVNAYYDVGPFAADIIRSSDALRFVTRVWLSPWVEIATFLTN